MATNAYGQFDAIKTADEEREWKKIYAGMGGTVNGVTYNPGFTPQGAVQANPGMQYNDWTELQAAPRIDLGTGSSGSSSSAASLADPFASERDQYKNELANLVKDPSSFFNSGLFKASTDYGIQAINRSAAAKKQLNSGNRLMELLNYGQATGAKNYFDQANLLGTLSGAKTSSPAAAASAQSAADSLDFQKQKYADDQLAAEKAAKAAGTQQWSQNMNNIYSNFAFG